MRGSPFAPGVVGDVNGLLGAIVAGPATNLPGFGYDPDTHTAFMPSGNTPGVQSASTASLEREIPCKAARSSRRRAMRACSR